MSCCGSSKVEDVSPILDVQKIIQDWAWEDFLSDVSPWRRMRLRRSKVDVEVPMNYYKFDDSEADLENAKPAGSPESKSELPNTNILSTDYENDTNMDQSYKFRMERARAASVNVTFQRGFSVGGKANFSIGVASGELETRLEVTKTSEQTFQETLTFETNSDITVEKNSTCTAQVIFTEKEITKKFKVKTVMRMPSGSAPIFIRRKKDQKLYASFTIRDLRIIFRKYLADKKVGSVELEPVNGKKKYGIEFTTTGIIEGIKLSGQTVKLQSRMHKPKKTEKIDIGGQQTINETLKEHKLKEASVTMPSEP